jgi:hypothetical protein
VGVRDHTDFQHKATITYVIKERLCQYPSMLYLWQQWPGLGRRGGYKGGLWHLEAVWVACKRRVPRNEPDDSADNDQGGGRRGIANIDLD